MADGNSSPAPSKPTRISGVDYQNLVMSIVESTLTNIIHDEVLSAHRAEKLLRMSSAATLATEAAIQQSLEASSTTNTKNNPQPPPSMRVEVQGAVYDSGRVYLKGNPLKVHAQNNSDVLCPYCKLPRLLYPITGVNGRLPDITKEWCTRHPFVQKPGHDIYGSPFPTDMAKTKKERELLKRQEKDSTPNSQDTGTPPGSQNTNGNLLDKLNPGSKPASYIPWHTCPNCKRSLLITRFAHHAEKCLGISGRQSSRNAMAKLNANGVTPLGSRMGTPQPGGSQGTKDKKSPMKKDVEEGEEGEETPKKKKKSSYIKKADREKMAAAAAAGGPAATKIKLSVSAAKRPPKPTSGESGDSGKADSAKREREDAGEDTPRKKIKLAKEESSTGAAKGAANAEDNQAKDNET